MYFIYFFEQKSPGRIAMVRAAIRVLFSRRVIIPRTATYIPANACVLVSPSDFGSLLRVVFDAAALLLRSFS